ncbi:MAG: HAD-IA family hydrolase [Halioglobus sp.]
MGELFEFVIDSSAVGVRKPDPGIFALALECLPGLRPQQALFLDDYPANMATACACGLQSLLVTEDLAPTIAELDALLQHR